MPSFRISQIRLWEWALVKVIIIASLFLFLSLFMYYSWNESGLRENIQWSGRISFVLFNMAFAASSVHFFYAGPFTWWWRTNRKFLGISFGMIHLMHLLFVLCLPIFHPVFALAKMSSLFGGTVAYVFVVAMLLTSFNTIKGQIHHTSWRLLHTVGAYWIWSIFLTTYIKRSLTEPIHWIYVAVLITVFLLRKLRMLKSRN